MSDKLAGGILAGSTSLSLPVVLRKTSDNTEATGKVAADMTLSYWRQGGTRTAVTGSDLAAVNSAYSSGGVKEVDSANMPGAYRLDVPDAAIATGADWVVISVKVASSYVFHERFALTTNVVQSGDNFARLGAPAGASVSADVAAVKAVLPAALVGGRIDASVGVMAANVLTASAINSGAITAAKFATDAIDSTALAASAVTEIQSGLATSSALATVQADTDDIQARLPAVLVGGRMDSSVGAMAANTMTAAAAAADLTTELQAGLATAAALATLQADTDDIQARLPTALVGGKMDSHVNDIAADAITASAIATDAFGALELAAGAAAEIGTAVRTELATELGRIDVAVSSRLATAGYTAPDNADIIAIKAKTDNIPPDPADASDIAALFAALPAAIWGFATRILTAGTNIVLAKGTGVTGLNDLDAAGVRAAVGLATPNLDTQLDALPTANENADQVWDEALAGHLTVGTTGAALNAASSAGDPWATALPGAYGPGTAGKILGTNLDAPVSGIPAAVWAVSVRTLSSFGTLVADVATAVWAATTRILTAGTNIALAKGTGVTGFNDLSAAQVNAEADTALSDAGVTSARMAHLDADVSTRLPTSGYVAPDNAGIATAVAGAAAIFARTDVATSTRLASSSYLAPDNPGIAVAAGAAASAATDAATLVGRLTALRAANLDNLDGLITGIPTAAENADKLLGRNIAGGSDGGHIVTDALRPLRNHTEIVNDVLNVYEEDGTTLAWTAPVTKAPGDPLASVSPS